MVREVITITPVMFDELQWADDLWLEVKLYEEAYKHDEVSVRRIVKRLSDGKFFEHDYIQSYYNGITYKGTELREVRKATRVVEEYE